MAHVVFAMYASQGTHAEFAERVGAMEFEVEGPLRKGVVRPILSEWKFYDIRIPESCAQELVGRIGAHPIDGQYVNKEQDGQGLWVLRWAFWLIRKFTPLKAIPFVAPKGGLDHLHDSWAYKFQIGVIKDPQQKIYGSGNKTREVL